ncbi:hypothetical protein GCM10011588_54000 [Nocardia jinanensis]|uniref:Uncharacterized protein n=1 Tax=Nocardia jinanensis TaxID=382504 RepID=A0A917VXW4_9NOCA|nr:hypothetical protein GCM10011588_54000 [Nocardia jinanensis]
MDDAAHPHAFSGSRTAPVGRSATSGASRAARSTEIGGWRALWRLDRHCVRIIEVRDESGSRVSVAGSPDLAEMRERWPDLTPLWDAVRHDLWTSVATAAGRG